MYVPESAVQRDYLYFPLYSYSKKEFPESSGLNAWNDKPKSKGSTTVRPKGEAYIPIPKALWKKRPFWVDPDVDMRRYDEYKRKTGESSYPINLHMPDGNVFHALFTQQDFKSLQTDPQSILGSWILNVLGITNPQRDRYDKPSTNIVTMKLLQQIGYDSLKLWHEDPANSHEVWIDFAEYGSFERFMKDKIQVSEEGADMLNNGDLKEINGHLILQSRYTSSPSNTAELLLGGSRNGWNYWKSSNNIAIGNDLR